MLQVFLVPALLDRVRLSRIDDELRLDAERLQAREEFVSLSDRDSGVVLTVQDQGWRPAVSDECNGRASVVRRAVRVGVSERDFEPRAARRRPREAEEVGVARLSDR